MMSIEEEVSAQLRGIQQRLDAFRDIINHPITTTSTYLNSNRSNKETSNSSKYSKLYPYNDSSKYNFYKHSLAKPRYSKYDSSSDSDSETETSDSYQSFTKPNKNGYNKFSQNKKYNDTSSDSSYESDSDEVKHGNLYYGISNYKYANPKSSNNYNIAYQKYLKKENNIQNHHSKYLNHNYSKSSKKSNLYYPKNLDVSLSSTESDSSDNIPSYKPYNNNINKNYPSYMADYNSNKFHHQKSSTLKKSQYLSSSTSSSSSDDYIKTKKKLTKKYQIDSSDSDSSSNITESEIYAHKLSDTSDEYLSDLSTSASVDVKNKKKNSFLEIQNRAKKDLIGDESESTMSTSTESIISDYRPKKKKEVTNNHIHIKEAVPKDYKPANSIFSKTLNKKYFPKNGESSSDTLSSSYYSSKEFSDAADEENSSSSSSYSSSPVTAIANLHSRRKKSPLVKIKEPKKKHNVFIDDFHKKSIPLSQKGKKSNKSKPISNEKIKTAKLLKDGDVLSSSSYSYSNDQNIEQIQKMLSKRLKNISSNTSHEQKDYVQPETKKQSTKRSANQNQKQPLKISTSTQSNQSIANESNKSNLVLKKNQLTSMNQTNPNIKSNKAKSKVSIDEPRNDDSIPLPIFPPDILSASSSISLSQIVPEHTSYHNMAKTNRENPNANSNTQLNDKKLSSNYNSNSNSNSNSSSLGNQLEILSATSSEPPKLPTNKKNNNKNNENEPIKGILKLTAKQPSFMMQNISDNFTDDESDNQSQTTTQPSNKSPNINNDNLNRNDSKNNESLKASHNASNIEDSEEIVEMSSSSSNSLPKKKKQPVTQKSFASSDSNSNVPSPNVRYTANNINLHENRNMQGDDSMNFADESRIEDEFSDASEKQNVLSDDDEDEVIPAVNSKVDQNSKPTEKLSDKTAVQTEKSKLDGKNTQKQENTTNPENNNENVNIDEYIKKLGAKKAAILGEFEDESDDEDINELLRLYTTT